MVDLAALAGAALLSFLWNNKDTTPKRFSPHVAVATMPVAGYASTSAVLPTVPAISAVFIRHGIATSLH